MDDENDEALAERDRRFTALDHAVNIAMKFVEVSSVEEIIGNAKKFEAYLRG